MTFSLCGQTVRGRAVSNDAEHKGTRESRLARALSTRLVGQRGGSHPRATLALLAQLRKDDRTKHIARGCLGTAVPDALREKAWPRMPREVPVFVVSHLLRSVHDLVHLRLAEALDAQQELQLQKPTAGARSAVRERSRARKRFKHSDKQVHAFLCVLMTRPTVTMPSSLSFFTSVALIPTVVSLSMETVTSPSCRTKGKGRCQEDANSDPGAAGEGLGGTDIAATHVFLVVGEVLHGPSKGGDTETRRVAKGQGSLRRRTRHRRSAWGRQRQARRAARSGREGAAGADQERRDALVVGGGEDRHPSGAACVDGE